MSTNRKAAVIGGVCVTLVVICGAVLASIGAIASARVTNLHNQVALAASGSSAPAHVYLTIATPDMLPGDTSGPAYLPSSFSVPANSDVTVTITDFDDATALPPQYAKASGIIGDLSITPLNPADPNSPGGTTIHTTSLDPNTGVGHTFTIASLGLNVPVAPKAVTTFTFHTASAGTVYSWRCMDPCGTGEAGWNGAMAMKGYMEGSITVV